ncbi:MAG: hypothetical protein WAT81_00925, partial [Candidatus Moraniibacteriota bacterium]
MRQRTDSRSGKASPTPLEKNFKEIVVGSGRSQEPYVIAFHYASDNISGAPLGTLFGFFEVEIHDQDAAYIVNFLASVAKKEYFANPRRSPIESFEAALHKINVALAEIVKHGNISWLGHLHGAIGAVNENCLNFSVTGEGELYLAREESLQSISVGLAETGNEPHPLKTFTEVSSGDLYDGDLIFAVSPSVWSLFSPEDLQRSLNRLGPAGFEQFLRTALVNELPIAAVTLLTCSAPVELKKEADQKKSSPKPAISLSNVWSDTPFVEAQQTKVTLAAAKPELSPVEPNAEKTTIDKKTGHIYVQASSDDTFEETHSPWKERYELYSNEFGTQLRSLSISLKKVSRRVGKESVLTLDMLSVRLATGRRTIGRKVRILKRESQQHWETYRQRQLEKKQATILKAAEESATPEPQMESVPEQTRPATPSESRPRETTKTPRPSSDRVRKFFDRPTRQETVADDPVVQPTAEPRERTLAIRFAVLPLLEKTSDSLKTLSRHASRGLSATATSSRTFWAARSPQERWVFIGGAVFIIGTLVFLAVPRGDTPPAETIATVTTPTPSAPTFPRPDEPSATLLAGNRLLFPTNNSRSLALLSINEGVWLVTERAIINLKTQESVAAPEPLRLATGMDDLDVIFTVGQSGSLYLWSTVTKKFEKNTLPLPDGAEVSAIGSYLTYLYVLDQNAGVIYRFPRAEGGFGAATTWSKEPVTADTKSL